MLDISGCDKTISTFTSCIISRTIEICGTDLAVQSSHETDAFGFMNEDPFFENDLFTLTDSLAPPSPISSIISGPSTCMAQNNFYSIDSPKDSIDLELPNSKKDVIFNFSNDSCKLSLISGITFCLNILDVLKKLRPLLKTSIVSDLLKHPLNIYPIFRKELTGCKPSNRIKSYDSFQVKFLACILHSLGDLLLSSTVGSLASASLLNSLGLLLNRYCLFLLCFLANWLNSLLLIFL